MFLCIYIIFATVKLKTYPAFVKFLHCCIYYSVEEKNSLPLTFVLKGGLYIWMLREVYYRIL